MVSLSRGLQRPDVENLFARRVTDSAVGKHKHAKNDEKNSDESQSASFRCGRLDAKSTIIV